MIHINLKKKGLICMRIVWKDSDPKTKTGQTVAYRGRVVTGYGGGWITDIPGDNNIYFPRECALNAIDIALGGKTRKTNPGRHTLGIKIVGQIGGDCSCG